MADIYNIDNHKLLYHPERVAEWFRGHGEWEKAKSIYPLYVEISPISLCNHRCTFCALDYIGYPNVSLDEGVLKKRLSEMKKLGVKSVMFAGEGEPTLWRPLPRILEHCSRIGLDTSMTTNMVLFTKKNYESFLKNCRWIKTSINAGTAETYSQIHRTKRGDFDRVMDNLRLCVEKRREKKINCTIGTQILLLPENAHEAVILAEKLKAIGVDYLVLKPYSQHMFSITRKYEKIDYRPFISLEDKLKVLEGNGFNVIFRSLSMLNVTEEERDYVKCLAAPFFWAYIMSDGSIYGCSAFLKNEDFCYGNINEASFKEIWEGKGRQAGYEFIKNGLNIEECRKNCRMDKVNCYLWKLKYPDAHTNFI